MKNTVRLALTITILSVLSGSVYTGMSGSQYREDCIPYDPSRLEIVDEGRWGWLLSDDGGHHRMAMFDNERDARLGLEVARGHTQMCFIGRDNRRPDRRTYIMQYWK